MEMKISKSCPGLSAPEAGRSHLEILSRASSHHALESGAVKGCLAKGIPRRNGQDRQSHAPGLALRGDRVTRHRKAEALQVVREMNVSRVKPRVLGKRKCHYR